MVCDCGSDMGFCFPVGVAFRPGLEFVPISADLWLCSNLTCGFRLAVISELDKPAARKALNFRRPSGNRGISGPLPSITAD